MFGRVYVNSRLCGWWASGGRSGLDGGLGIGGRTHRRSPPIVSTPSSSTPIDDRTAVPASIAPRTGDLRFVIRAGRQLDKGA